MRLTVTFGIDHTPEFDEVRKVITEMVQKQPGSATLIEIDYGRFDSMITMGGTLDEVVDVLLELQRVTK